MEYLDFAPRITDKSQIKEFIEADSGVKAQEGKLLSAFDVWWELHSPNLAKLPQTKAVMALRGEFLSSFVQNLEPVGLLDRFKVAGVVASWWEEVKYELRTLSESGFGGLVDSWVDTVKDALEGEEDSKTKTKFDPLNHKLVMKLLPDYLQEITETEAQIAELEQQKEAFERGEDSEDSEGENGEDEAVNVVKEWENRLKTLKFSIKEQRKRISFLSRGKGSIATQKKQGKDTTALEHELAELLLQVEPIEEEITAIEEQLKPYNEIKEKLKEAKATLKTLKAQLMERLDEARQTLSDDECQKLVLGIFKEGIKGELDRYVTAHRQQVIATVEIWWDKYRVTLVDIEKERDAAATRLGDFLRGLGYVS